MVCARLAAVLTCPIAVVAQSFGSEVISDITTSGADEGRALEVKSERFWRPVLQAAERAEEVREHAAVYAAAEAALAGLGADHGFVREALGDALSSLRRADKVLLARGTDQARLASERLASAPSSRLDWGRSISFLSGGQWGDLLLMAVRRFVDGGRYGERLREHVHQRREEALPALRGASAALGDVGSDCRRASVRAYDVLKYDIYNRGVAKTPKAAKDAADMIAAASRDTRRLFWGLVTPVAEGITKDAEAKHELPSATVTRALLEDVEPRALPSHVGQLMVEESLTSL